jgi:hypothetical protein
MKPAKPTTRGRTHHAAGKPLRHATVLPPQDQPVSADRIRDERLQKELTEHEAYTIAARHRDGLTAIESEMDDVPEDEEALDAAADLEADKRRALKRQPGEEG